MNTDPTLTEAEQAAIDEGVADDAAAVAQAAADANPAPAATPDPVAEATPDPVLAAIAENAAATRTLAEQIAADRAAAAEANKPAPVVEATPDARDFDAERRALKDQYEAGDLTQDEYDEKRDAIAEAKADAKIASAIAAAEAKRVADETRSAEQRAADAKAADEAAWKSANDTFFADPSNAALIEGSMKRGTFVGALEEVAAENPGIGYTDMLVKAREKVTGVAAVDTTQKVREATFERRNEAGATPPVTLRDVPNSGNPVGSDPGASLDNLPIHELEAALARMSISDRNRYLAGAPGNT